MEGGSEGSHDRICSEANIFRTFEAFELIVNYVGFIEVSVPFLLKNLVLVFWVIANLVVLVFFLELSLFDGIVVVPSVQFVNI
jgi:hypothetical protein